MAYLFFSRKKIALSFFYVVSFLLILYGYYTFIVPLYGYTGFLWNLNRNKIAEGIVLTFFISFLLPSVFKKPSDIFLHLQLLFPIIPMLVIYGAESYPRIFLYYIITSFLLLNLFNITLNTYI